MRICFVGYFLPGRVSGPTDSVINLAKHLDGLADSVKVVSSSQAQLEMFEIAGVNIFPLSEARGLILDSDIVVLCGVYDLQIAKLCRFAKKVGTPYVISARGNLTRASQKKSYFKKLLYRSFFVNSVINKAAAIHYLTKDEEISSLFYPVEKFVVPNGVYPPQLDSYRVAGCDYDKTIVFLGRLDIYHKGIDIVLNSISILKDQFRSRGWKVRFFGPPFTARDSEWIADFISANNISDIVSFSDAVHGEDKFSAIGKGRFFIHASRYEGQPQAVLQAMAVGSIPLISRSCNLGTLNGEHRFALEFDASPESLVKIFEKLFVLEVAELDKLSRLNREVARQEFRWDVIARDFYLYISRLMN